MLVDGLLVVGPGTLVDGLLVVGPGTLVDGLLVVGPGTPKGERRGSSASVKAMEAVPPPNDLGQRDASTPQGGFGSWISLRDTVWGSPQYLRLWLAQLVTQIGEWVFLFAIAIKAADVGPGTPEGAVAIVLMSRLVPGFFLGPFAGVLADRWDRRKLMASCDVARVVVVCFYPFVSHVWQLVILNVILEAFTLLWIPSKDALMPNLLPAKHLPTANTLSAAATYGTLPVAVLLMWVFTRQSTDGTIIAFFFNAATFVVSAALIMSIVISKRARSAESRAHSIADNKLELGVIWQDVRAGWALIFGDPVLRAVNIGLTVALIGGSMVAVLGRIYVAEVLGSTSNQFELLAGFGLGVVIGVLILLAVSQRIDRPWVFSRALMLGGVALFVATSVDSLGVVVILLALAGAAVGIVYILGYTILQETASDELRGRVFGAFNNVSRVGMALILVAGPAITVVFDRATELTVDGSVRVFDHELLIPGVRITFWLTALIIVGAGASAMRTLRGVGTSGRASADLRSVT